MLILREKIRYYEHVLPFKLSKHVNTTLFKWSNPYKEEIDKTNCIFIHIPKNAGTSISSAVYGRTLGHVPVSRYKAFDQSKFNRYFKFAIVRNPWDRLHSAFEYLKTKKDNNDLDACFYQKYLSRNKSFEKFVLRLQDPYYRFNVLTYKHFIPQYKWICLPKNNQHLMNRILRFEQLQEDLKELDQHIAINSFKRIPHLRRINKKVYTSVYSDNMKDIVSRIYQKDISLFNYKFL
jgi:hypothetical protein